MPLLKIRGPATRARHVLDRATAHARVRLHKKALEIERASGGCYPWSLQMTDIAPASAVLHLGPALRTRRVRAFKEDELADPKVLVCAAAEMFAMRRARDGLFQKDWWVNPRGTFSFSSMPIIRCPCRCQAQ